MRYRLRTLLIVMNKLILSGLVLLACGVTAGDDPKAGEKLPPKTITVKDALAFIADAKPSGQGCGGTTWNNEAWSFYLNEYQRIRVPWLSEPQKVSAAFVFGKKPGEHHLVEFSGPGFKYVRPTADAAMHFEPPPKE